MAGREFITTISINGDLDSSVQKAFDQMANKLDAVRKATVQTASVTDKLSMVIEAQSDELEAAKKAYTDYLLSGEKSRKKAKELEGNIKKLSGELSTNEKKMAEAKKAAEKLSGGLDKTDDAARDCDEGFTIMKGAASQLVAKGITALASACVDVAKTIAGLAESTREYREDMGKLETAFEAAGKSTELATKTYKHFYSVLGEEDRSVEAVNHLAKFVETEKDMQAWTNICAGVWGTFGDSLPIEGLTEAANETAKVGKVTGPLADALNWAGVNEETFQKSLEKCSSEQERAALITETLNSLYSDAASKYRENNASIIDARMANSEYTDTVAKMGAIIEPITTKVQEGFTRILEKVIELISNGDVDAFGEKVAQTFGEFTDKALPKIINALEWIFNNTGLLKGIAIAIGAVAAAIGIMNVAMSIQNAIMLASPTTWIVLGIVAAITALIAIIVLCVKHWDKIKQAAVSAVEWIKNAWNSVASWFNKNVIQPISTFFSNLWEGITKAVKSVADWFKNAWNAVSNWFKDNWKTLLLFITNPIAGVFKYLYDNFEGFRNFVNNIVSSVKQFFVDLWTGFANGAIKAWQGVKNTFATVAEFFRNIFSNAWTGVKQVFSVGGEVFDGIKDGIVTAFNTVVNALIRGINKVVKLPFEGLNKILDKLYDLEIANVKPFQWLKWRAPIPQLPELATGGFTEGVSIAGEAGTEAVISFDKAYRAQNLSYWAQAGRMLGATAEDYTLGGSSGGSSVNLGGISFAPNITINGNADKSSIVEAIEEEYPEFIDMLEDWFTKRGVLVYD